MPIGANVQAVVDRIKLIFQGTDRSNKESVYQGFGGAVLFTKALEEPYDLLWLFVKLSYDLSIDLLYRSITKAGKAFKEPYYLPSSSKVSSEEDEQNNNGNGNGDGLLARADQEKARANSFDHSF